MPRFITVTPNPALDKNYTIPNFQPGEVRRPESTHVSPGGKGINVARILKTLGADVTAVGFIGGANGARVQAGLDREGIGYEFVNVGPEETRLAIVIIDPNSSQQTVVNEIGPRIAERHRIELTGLLGRRVGADDAAVFSGSFPPGLPEDSYAVWIDNARGRGALTLLDASGDVLIETLSRTRPDVLKINGNEARALGVQIEDWKRDAAAAAQALRMERGIDYVSLTGGADGAVLAGPGGVFSARMPKMEIVSAVGSGDAFAAGMIYSFAVEPGNLVGALRLACACGGASALSDGAGYCSREQIERVSGRINLVNV